MRTRIPSAALLLLVFILFLAGCGGGGDQSGNGGSQDGGAPGGGEQQQQQGGAPQEGAAPARKIALGTVVSVEPDKRKIVLQPTAEVQGERMTFKVRKNAEITLDDKAAEMADVKEGQEAQIQYVVKNEVNRARSVALISGGQ